LLISSGVGGDLCPICRISQIPLTELHSEDTSPPRPGHRDRRPPVRWPGPPWPPLGPACASVLRDSSGGEPVILFLSRRRFSWHSTTGAACSGWRRSRSCSAG